MNAQPSFDFRYPNTPGFKRRATSEDAADAIAPRAETLRDKVYALLSAKPMTADECAEWLGEDKLTIRPRLSELARQERIIESGTRRRNASGKMAIVWRVADKTQTAVGELMEKAARVNGMEGPLEITVTR